MRSALIFLSALVAVGQGNFVGNILDEVKPLIKDAVKDTNRALSQSFLAKQAQVKNADKTKNQLVLADKFSEAVGQELERIIDEIQKSLLTYEARSEEVKAIIHKFVDEIENPPLTKINYIPILAENIVNSLTEINKLMNEGNAALQNAKSLAASIEKDAIFKSVIGQVSELQTRGPISWIANLIGNGAQWIMENLHSVLSGIHPSLGNSFMVVNFLATTIVNNISMLGGAITQGVAEQLLSLLSPWKEELGQLYQQIEFTLQQTFPLLFSDKRLIH